MIVRDSKLFGTRETGYGRYYYLNSDPDTLYPSVSTIVKGVPKKKTSGWTSVYASIGSAVHWNILKRYADRPLSRPTDPFYGMEASEVTRRINSCVKQWQDLQLRIKPIAVETALFSEDPRIGGRLDMFCYLDGIRTLLDIKTGKEYRENPIQASAYVHMLKWSPRQVALVYLDADMNRNPEEKGHVKIIEKQDLEAYFDVFKDKYSNFEMPDLDNL